MKIKEYRQKLGMSQTEMSQKLGIPPSTLFNYETERAEPSIQTLVKYANLFNVSLDELVGRPTENVNLNALSENEAYLIRKILKMNDRELLRTKAFVMGLTEE